MTKEEIRSYLEETRRGFLDSLAHLTEDQIYRRAEPGEWSVAEILAHLPVGERHIRAQAEAIVETGAATFLFLSPQEREESAARAQEMVPPQMINDLIGARRQTLALLDRLETADLDKTAEHERLGVMTVGAIIRAIGRHENDHEQQVRRLRQQMEADTPSA
jgi:hypothetical protein